MSLSFRETAKKSISNLKSLAFAYTPLALSEDEGIRSLEIIYSS